MKCAECDQKAKWLIIDEPPYEQLFFPLCEDHFQELCHMEGEMNLDFEYIEGLSLDRVVQIINEKWLYMNKKYRNLLNQYDKLKKELDK